MNEQAGQTANMIEFRDVSVCFAALRAVDQVSLAVRKGESVGIVGESGCGKSTLARTMVGLLAPTTGTVLLDGEPVGRRRAAADRRRVQMVFQDPASSLNPARTIGHTLAELLRVHRVVPRGDIRRRCAELLDLVQLPQSALGVRPRALSGGQRQRVGIARALALGPDVIVADEAVASLDVSVQASILNLLADLRRSLGLTLVFISHDLAVVRHVSERVAVMYLGRVVETGSTAELFSRPRHPYTKALLAAVPRPGGVRAGGAPPALPGEPASPLGLPVGCRFAPRCALAEETCRRAEPPLEGATGHLVACHLAPAEGS